MKSYPRDVSMPQLHQVLVLVSAWDYRRTLLLFSGSTLRIEGVPMCAYITWNNASRPAVHESISAFFFCTTRRLADLHRQPMGHLPHRCGFHCPRKNWSSLPTSVRHPQSLVREDCGEDGRCGRRVKRKSSPPRLRGSAGQPTWRAFRPQHALTSTFGTNLEMRLI